MYAKKLGKNEIIDKYNRYKGVRRGYTNEYGELLLSFTEQGTRNKRVFTVDEEKR
jgi:hypothetical protein